MSDFVLLPRRATRALELMDVMAAAVAPKQTSSLVRLLTSSLQQPELAHVKRVHRADGQRDGELLVLLWPADAAPSGVSGEALLQQLASFELQVPCPPARLLARSNTPLCAWHSNASCACRGMHPSRARNSTRGVCTGRSYSTSRPRRTHCRRGPCRPRPRSCGRCMGTCSAPSPWRSARSARADALLQP